MKFTPALRQATKILIRSDSGIPTGLAGIHQHPDPRPALISLYKLTLTAMEKGFPKESIYRQSVEALTKNRLAIVEAEEITENIEKKIGGGLIEEIIIQADEELMLAKELSGLKVWEELEEKPLEDQWVYFGKKI